MILIGGCSDKKTRNELEHMKDGMQNSSVNEFYYADQQEVNSVTDVKMILKYTDVDLNNDGLEDKIVIIRSPIHSGSQGDSFEILLNINATFIKAYTGVFRLYSQEGDALGSVVVLTEVNNGWKSIKVETDDKTITLQYNNEKYGIELPEKSSESEPDIQQLKVEDFKVYSEKNTIELGSLYEKFTENNTEKEEGFDYVGEIYKENQPCYKVYNHYYADFDMYTSNLNYDVENRDFNTYIIQQITLKTPVYKTNRDISIGSGLNDVINAYGEGNETLENENRTLVYTFGNKSIRFMFDKQDIVEGIVLVVLVLE